MFNSVSLNNTSVNNINVAQTVSKDAVTAAAIQAIVKGETTSAPEPVVATPATSSPSIDKVIRSVHDKFTKLKMISINRLERSFPDFDDKSLDQVAKAVDPRYQAQRVEYRAALDAAPIKNSFVYSELMAKAGEKSSLGNCDVMCSIAMFDLMEKCGPRTKIDKYAVETGDHAFIVVGREMESDPYDHTTWGPNAMVYDPWSSSAEEPMFFPASDIPTKLKCVDTEKEGTLKSVATRSFDITTDRIAPVTSNIFSVTELKLEMGPEVTQPYYGRVIQDLAAFHEGNETQKVVMATQIVGGVAKFMETLKDYSIEQIPEAARAVSTLYRQLSIFLQKMK